MTPSSGERRPGRHRERALAIRKGDTVIDHDDVPGDAAGLRSSAERDDRGNVLSTSEALT